jgi:hypothetical protein
MYCHQHPHKLVIEILTQIATEKHKSLARIKRLLFIKENPPVIQRFWQILDEKLPHHTFTYVGCCGECGSLDLR